MSYTPTYARNKQGLFSEEKAFASSFIGTNAYITDDEMNELQWILHDQATKVQAMTFGSGYFSKGADYINSASTPRVLTIAPRDMLIAGFRVRLEGLVANGGNTRVNLPEKPTADTRNDLVYILMKLTEVNYQSNIYRHGGTANEIMTNDLLDGRMEGETSRRVQKQWTVLVAAGTTDISSLGYSATSYDPRLFSKTNTNCIGGLEYALPLYTIIQTPTTATYNDIAYQIPTLDDLKGGVKSVAGKTGVVELAPEDVGASPAEILAALKTVDGTESGLDADQVDGKHANGTLQTTEKSNLVGAINELFTDVSNGKDGVASAVTDMGQAAAGSDTFSALAGKIRDISKDATATSDDIIQSKTAYSGGIKVTGSLVPGADTADATAAAADILASYTAYARGSKLTGTMVNNGTIMIDPGMYSKPIPQGYHSGNGGVLGDPNLTASNIKYETNIFGTIGNFTYENSNPAGVSDILSGKVAYVNGAKKIGMMVNRGAVTIDPGYTNQVIPAGYHNGNGGVLGDPNLIASNIKYNANIFGTTGNFTYEADNPAGVSHILSGRVAYVNGTKRTGMMVDQGAINITPGQTAKSIPQGYHNGNGMVLGDANLASSNVKYGSSIFGTDGAFTYEWSNPAGVSDILSDKVAYVNGAKKTGMMTNNGATNASLAINGSYTIPQGYHNGSGKITQSIATKSAQTYTPGTANQTITAYQYLTGNQTIKGDANLTSANIRSGVSIFNKSGSLIPGSINPYIDGTENIAIIQGYTSQGSSSGTAYTKFSDKVHLHVGLSGTVYVVTEASVDLTHANFVILEFSGEFVTADSDNRGSVAIKVSNVRDNDHHNLYKSHSYAGTKDDGYKRALFLDVRSITGSYYIKAAFNVPWGSDHALDAYVHKILIA